MRDLILGVRNYDLDIAVEGDGIIFAKELAGRLKSDLRVHEHFGTATLVLPGSLKVDIASTRQERYPCCASLPEVVCSGLKEDLLRRDFTINTMAVGISRNNRYRLIDPFNGKKDLLSAKIRILHDLSFQDDPTRILRAIRFEQRFNFTIEPKTLLLLKDAIKKRLLDKVSPHRLRDELILILKENNPWKQTRRLDNLCSLSFISPKLRLEKSTARLFKSVDQEVLWFRNKFPGYRQLDTWLIYFSAILKPLSFNEIKKIVLKFGLRKGEAMRVFSYCRLNQKLLRFLSKKNILPARIFQRLKPLSYETIILLRAGSANKYLKEYTADFLEIYNGMRLFVSGKDLAGLGVLPGPKYQKIFSRVLEAKLNGKLKDRRGELFLIKKLIENSSERRI